MNQRYRSEQICIGATRKKAIGVGLLVVFALFAGCGGSGPGTGDSGEEQVTGASIVQINSPASMAPCQETRERLEETLQEEANRLASQRGGVSPENPVNAPYTLHASRYRDELIKLANTGEVCAYYGLGTLYLLGWDDVPIDREQARTWLQKGIDAEHQLSIDAYRVLADG